MNQDEWIEEHERLKAYRHITVTVSAWQHTMMVYLDSLSTRKEIVKELAGEDTHESGRVDREPTDPENLSRNHGDA